MKTYLVRINYFLFVLLSILTVFFTSAIINLFLSPIYDSNGPNLATNTVVNVVKSIFSAGIFTPIVESFLFQHVIFIILKKNTLSQKKFLNYIFNHFKFTICTISLLLSFLYYAYIFFRNSFGLFILHFTI